MKLYIITLVLLVGSGLCTGQQISRAEYFIGEDPGFGLAIPIPISLSEGDLSLDFAAEIHALSEGFHFISIRARDDLGKWGLPVQRIFYVFKDLSTEENKITGIEYFIDTDPGFGNGTAVSLPSSGNDLAVTFVVNVAALTDGDHILYVRSKNALNRWGQMYSQGFTSLYTSVGGIKVASFFKLYPNPGDGNFYLEFSEELNGPVKLNIKDLSGKTVYLKEYYTSSNSLNINLPAGLYLLNVKSKDKNFTQKIIIH
jgi:hypothetical protein